jgi:hypothetical protein
VDTVGACPFDTPHVHVQPQSSNHTEPAAREAFPLGRACAAFIRRRTYNRNSTNRWRTPVAQAQRKRVALRKLPRRKQVEIRITCSGESGNWRSIVKVSLPTRPNCRITFSAARKKQTSQQGSARLRSQVRNCDRTKTNERTLCVVDELEVLDRGHCYSPLEIQHVRANL